MFVTTVFGIIASITSLIGLLPQIVKSFQTKSTKDISMMMLINFLICSLAWIIYGVCTEAGFVVLSNVLGLLSCLFLIFQKKYYDAKSY